MTRKERRVALQDARISWRIWWKRMWCFSVNIFNKERTAKIFRTICAVNFASFSWCSAGTRATRRSSCSIFISFLLLLFAHVRPLWRSELLFTFYGRRRYCRRRRKKKKMANGWWWYMYVLHVGAPLCVAYPRTQRGTIFIFTFTFCSKIRCTQCVWAVRIGFFLSGLAIFYVGTRGIESSRRQRCRTSGLNGVVERKGMDPWRGVKWVTTKYSIWRNSFSFGACFRSLRIFSAIFSAINVFNLISGWLMRIFENGGSPLQLEISFWMIP